MYLRCRTALRGAFALAILFKKRLLDFAHKRAGGNYNPSGTRLNVLTVVTGLVLGTMVALTSIGAGALGTVALFILYPLLPTRRLVGTEIAHAVPLTLVAGLGHASMGNMDWQVLGFLLIGSLPGIYLGSHLTGRISDEVLRPCLFLTLSVFIYYNSQLFTVLGNGITSRIFDIPVKYITRLSNPNPKPA